MPLGGERSVTAGGSEATGQRSELTKPAVGEAAAEAQERANQLARGATFGHSTAGQDPPRIVSPLTHELSASIDTSGHEVAPWAEFMALPLGAEMACQYQAAVMVRKARALASGSGWAKLSHSIGQRSTSSTASSASSPRSNAFPTRMASSSGC